MSSPWLSLFHRRSGSRNQPIAVIGMGRFGRSVARTLHAAGHEVLVVDRNEELVNAALSDENGAAIATQALNLDSVDQNALRQAGIDQFPTVIVAIGHYFEASVLTTLNLKKIGCPEVIAKAISDVHGEVLAQIGADHVVYPEKEMGRIVAQQLMKTGFLHSMLLDTDHSVIEMIAPHPLTGHTLAELQLRPRFGISVLAIRHDDKLNVNPLPSDRINQGDLIVVIGSHSDLERLAHLSPPNEILSVGRTL